MTKRRANLSTASRLGLLTLTAIGISACSSSSGPAVQEGRIIDTAVAGITYSTATQSGTTGTNGEFSFIAGETVTFSIGALEVATVPAKETINWFELGGLTQIPVGYNEIEPVLYDNWDEDGDGVYDAPSLSRVGAIAALFTTLDTDRESANGIVVSAGVASRITADVEVDLGYANGPRWSPDLRLFMRRVAADGILPAREIRNGGLELALLYQRMGVDPQYKVSTRNTRDDNADGTDNWLRLLTYDAATGKVSRDEYDTNNDGVIDDVFTLSYSAELYGDVYTTDRNNDGVEATRDWDLDEFGFVVRYEETRDNALYQLETRQLDPETGLYVRREVINPVRGVHTIETWTMDENGNRPLATIDFNGDGTPETIVNLTYDAPNSYWTGREDDTNNDGIIDSRTTRVVDEDGNVLRLERDMDADGTVDYLEERSFDARGNLLRSAIDNNNDGVPESLQVYERNSRGLATRSSRQENGVLMRADETSYNSLGQRLTQAIDSDGDGSFDRRTFWTYDANNRLVETRRDNGDDGVIDTITTQSFDSNGRLLETRTDNNADGTVDNITRRRYNADGYLASHESESNGVLRSVARYTDYVATSIAALF